MLREWFNFSFLSTATTKPKIESSKNETQELSKKYAQVLSEFSSNPTLPSQYPRPSRSLLSFTIPPKSSFLSPESSESSESPPKSPPPSFPESLEVPLSCEERDREITIKIKEYLESIAETVGIVNRKKRTKELLSYLAENRDFVDRHGRFKEVLKRKILEFNGQGHKFPVEYALLFEEELPDKNQKSIEDMLEKLDEYLCGKNRLAQNLFDKLVASKEQILGNKKWCETIKNRLLEFDNKDNVLPWHYNQRFSTDLDFLLS